MEEINMKYAEVKENTTITVAATEFIVLEKQDDKVICLTRDLAFEDEKFDKNSNNYATSDVKKKLDNEFLPKLVEAVGADNILDVDIDLTSDDGLDDYGSVKDKIGLLTDSMYRKYNRIIENYPVDNWWWLATPYSTPHRGYRSLVRCVSRIGTLFIGSCGRNCGVRPFCIFSSAIFES